VGRLTGRAGVPAAFGDIVWTAPSASCVSGASATVENYYLLVASTSTDDVNNYMVKVTLTRIDGTLGSVTFGSAVEPATNYVFTGAHAGYAGAGTNNTTTVTGSDALDSGTESLGTTAKNLVKTPLNIAAGTAGTWEIAFADSVTSPTGDCVFFDDATPFPNELPNDSFHSGTITVTPEPTCLLLLAGGALGLLRRRRA